MPDLSRIAKTTATAALALLLAAPSVSAQTGGTLAQRNEDITDTRHNFSVSSSRPGTAATLPGTFVDYGEICVYCHTPHGGNYDQGPLWNRDAPAASYQMYNEASNTGQSDLDMSFAGTPNGVSAACLTCHEGTMGVDVVVNAPNTAWTGTADQGSNMAAMFTTSPDNLKVIGADLRNDHPISMVYDPAQDDQFRDLAVVTNGDRLKLFGGGVGTGTVECATCHNPHTAYETFLRIPNAASALCLTCHTK
jgi:predicted CXXCH cytochrome family protein